MTVLFEIALKTSALLLLALATVTVLRHQSAAVRHLVLAAAFVGAIAIPLLTMAAPVWSLPLPSWVASTTPSNITFSGASPSPASIGASPSTTSASARTGLAASQILVALWLVGGGVNVAIVLAGIWRVRRLAALARPIDSGVWREHADAIASAYGITRHVELRHSAHPTMLVTWGAWRPRVLLPAAAATWSDDRIRVVLYHELAHVQRRDWALLMIASLVRVLHWWNPLIWLASRRLRQESEQAADDLVLARGIPGPDYAAHLLAVARESIRQRHTWSAVTAIAHPSTLEGRIRAMLNTSLNRTPPSGIGRLATGLSALAVTTFIAGAGISTFAAPAPVPVSLAAATAPSIVTPPASPAIETHATTPRGPIAAPAVRAQQATGPSGPGTITGVLYDQLGGLLPGTSAVLVQRSSGATYRTDSDRNGAFSFALLPPGDYELTTSLPGFATVTNLVKVGAGQVIDRAVTLPIGTLQESISVVGGDGVVLSSKPSGYTDRPRTRPAPEARTFYSGGIGGQIRTPRKVVHVNPVYPSGLGPNASGIVKLQARVGIDGYLSDIRDSTGGNPSPTHQAFLDSALDAVRQWEFTPVLLNNVPVEASITISIDYSTR